MTDVVAEYGLDQAQAFLKLGIRAVLAMPLIKNNKLIAMMAVHSDVARTWTPAEISLVTSATERCWAYIERVRGDIALRESAARFGGAVGALQGVLWTNDAEGRMRGEQPGWAALTGQSFAEYQNYGWSAAVHPDDAQGSIDAWNEAVAGRKPFVHEHRVKRGSDGAWRQFSIRAIPILDDGGAIREWVGVHTDVTELRDLTTNLALRVAAEVSERIKAEDALRQTQRTEMVGKLTGGIAHDFNNLLMAVLANLDLLRKHYQDDPKAMRLVGGAIKGAERGAALTQRLLAFARRQDLKVEPTNIGGLVSGMLDLIKQSLGSQVDLDVSIPPYLPLANMDVNQIELALLNLVINARDAMPDGGVLRIVADEIDGDADGELQLGRYIRLIVVDSGSGMDAETLRRATEPFFTTKELGKGTGLGLSMIQGVAVQLNGTLKLTSRIGEGTRAELWLPQSAEVESSVTKHEAKVESALNSKDHKKMTVLVVDDDALIAMSTADMLADLGHKVIEANSGKQALELLAAHPDIDFIVTDYSMPGLTGVQVAKLADDLKPGIPVLLATGYAELPAGSQSNLLRIGKPYQLHQLEAAIAKLLCGMPAGS